MGQRFYKLVYAVLMKTMKPMAVEWETEPPTEPCCFVPNHVGINGPLQMVIHFPLKDQIAVWCNSGMMIRKEVPAYVRQDYWWAPDDKLAPFYDKTLPYIAAVLMPAVLNPAPTIPVYHDSRIIRTMHESLNAMKKGKHLVIFPEQPAGHGLEEMQINTGFLSIAPLYYRRSGKAMRFYPVHIDLDRHVFHIAAPIDYDPERTLEEQTDELVRVLSNGLRGWDADTPLQREKMSIPVV